MNSIAVLDTSVNDENLGNHIIMDSVYSVINELFLNNFIYHLPYAHVDRGALKAIQKSELCFFGGTNSLCAEMNEYTQWGITPKLSKIIRNFVLLGLGWWQYQGAINRYTKKLLRDLLLNCYLHSVRDHYTAKKLQSIGIENVITTGCPSLWNLENYSVGPNGFEEAVITVTDYNQNVQREKEWISLVAQMYKKVYLWLQGAGDYQYFMNNHFAENVKIIPPRVSEFDRALENESIDYIGTRLHGGIRALQKKKRTIVIAIDNRGMEMGRDFNLPFIRVDEIPDMQKKLIEPYQTRFNIPRENIQKWKSQFIRTTA
jgi:hypothetical protein